jgi:hypothetical protein
MLATILRRLFYLALSIKIKIYRSIILTVGLYGYEAWSHVEGETQAEGVQE